MTAPSSRSSLHYNVLDVYTSTLGMLVGHFRVYKLSHSCLMNQSHIVWPYSMRRGFMVSKRPANYVLAANSNMNTSSSKKSVSGPIYVRGRPWHQLMRCVRTSHMFPLPHTSAQRSAGVPYQQSLCEVLSKQGTTRKRWACFPLAVFKLYFQTSG